MVLNTNYEEEVLKILRTLDENKKQEVLNYLRIIDTPKGESGQKIIADSLQLNFDDDSIREIEEAINSDCEVIEGFKEINLDE